METESLPLCQDHLRRLLDSRKHNTQEIILLCIGTDRIMGDSLGPLVGSMVERARGLHCTDLHSIGSFADTACCNTNLSSNTPLHNTGMPLIVYGTLQHTIHALNLSEIHAHIKKKHPHSLVIAVDASLGSCENIGSVFVRPGGLHPGAGVNKNLPCLGDISITGITGEQSRHPYLALQTVRLSTIARMAEHICECILGVCAL